MAHSYNDKHTYTYVKGGVSAMRQNTTTTAWVSIIAMITILNICATVSAQVVETGRLNLPDSRYQVSIIGPGGEVYVALDTVCIAYDTTFSEMWRTQIPNTSPESPWTEGFLQDMDGNLLILKENYHPGDPGHRGTFHIVVTKIGKDGALHWSRELTAAPGFPDYNSYSRGPNNFWTDPQGNIYVHDMISVNISGNCWSEVDYAQRSWLFSLAPSGSDRWSIVKSAPDDVNISARPLGFASDGSCYIWNNVVGSDCWGSNAFSNCIWIDSCTPTLTYTMAHYNSAGTLLWEIPINGSVLASIAPSGNQYRYDYNSNVLWKYNPDGTQMWSFTAIEERIGRVVVSDNEEHALLRLPKHMYLRVRIRGTIERRSNASTAMAQSGGVGTTFFLHTCHTK